MKHSTTPDGTPVITYTTTDWDEMRAANALRDADADAAERAARQAKWVADRKAYEAAQAKAAAEAKPAARVRRFGRLLVDAARSVVAPATLVADKATEAPAVEATETTAPDPADVLDATELPDIATIETAAADYDQAADMARAADRAKRKAKKTLSRLPAGRYGAWIVERVASNKQTPDLVAIRATYERLGLGEVPMRAVAPSLKVRPAPAEVAEDGPLLASAA